MGIKINDFTANEEAKIGKRTDPKKFYVNDTGAEIDVSEIGIVKAAWDPDAGTLAVEFAIGGKDLDGVFHRDASAKVARYRFGRTLTPKLWNQFGLDEYPSLETIEQLLMTDKAALRTVGCNTWGLSSISVDDKKAE